MEKIILAYGLKPSPPANAKQVAARPATTTQQGVHRSLRCRQRVARARLRLGRTLGSFSVMKTHPQDSTPERGGGQGGTADSPMKAVLRRLAVTSHP
jgi:hypothetical protein